MEQRNLRKSLLILPILIIIFIVLHACQQKEHEEANFPKEKTIRIVNPYGAGGSMDRSVRILASVAPEYVGQHINVISMPGAGGQDAINFVMEQPTDGYSLLATDYGPLVITALIEKVNYDLNDWIPIFQITEVAPVFFTQADSPIKSIEDWIAELKKDPESLSVAHGRFLSVPHLPLILFEILAGVKNRHVPTTGGSEAMAFVLGKKVDLGASVTSTVAASVKSGDLRALALCSAERVTALPNTPTMKELGYDVILPAWFIIFAPKNVPLERIEFLNEKFVAAMNSESAISLASKSDVVISPSYSMEELQQVYKATIENLKKILTAIGR